MIYTTLLAIGLLGLVVQLVLGLGHGSHVGHTHTGHGHFGHGHGGHAQAGHSSHVGGQHGHAASHSASQAGSHAQHGPTQGHENSSHSSSTASQNGLAILWTMLSPLTLFSLCVGAGVTGLLLHDQHLHWPDNHIALAAGVGALGFYFLIVRPLSGFVFQFASKPSEALEGTLAQTAEAMTPFDSTGKGIVRLNVDGQLVRILATLERSEPGTYSPVQPGDQLMVTEIDGRSNTCKVLKL